MKSPYQTALERTRQQQSAHLWPRGVKAVEWREPTVPQWQTTDNTPLNWQALKRGAREKQP